MGYPFYLIFHVCIDRHSDINIDFELYLVQVRVRSSNPLRILSTSVLKLHHYNAYILKIGVTL